MSSRLLSLSASSSSGLDLLEAGGDVGLVSPPSSFLSDVVSLRGCVQYEEAEVEALLTEHLALCDHIRTKLNPATVSVIEDRVRMAAASCEVVVVRPPSEAMSATAQVWCEPAASRAGPLPTKDEEDVGSAASVSLTVGARRLSLIPPRRDGSSWRDSSMIFLSEGPVSVTRRNARRLR
jgi:hypothetical protein